MPSIQTTTRTTLQTTKRRTFRAHWELVPNRDMVQSTETGRVYVFSADLERCSMPVERSERSKALSAFKLFPAATMGIPERMPIEILRESPRRWRKVAEHAIA